MQSSAVKSTRAATVLLLKSDPGVQLTRENSSSRNEAPTACVLGANRRVVVGPPPPEKTAPLAKRQGVPPFTRGHSKPTLSTTSCTWGPNPVSGPTVTVALFIEVGVPPKGPTRVLFRRVRARVAPSRLAPRRSAPVRSAPDRLAPKRFAPCRFVPTRIVPWRLAMERFWPERSWPDRSWPERSWRLGSVACRVVRAASVASAVAWAAAAVVEAESAEACAVITATVFDPIVTAWLVSWSTTEGSPGSGLPTWVWSVCTSLTRLGAP